MKQAIKVKVKYFNPACKLGKIKQGDWIDVRAAQAFNYTAGQFILIPLGFAMELPAGHEAHLAPRGSTYKNFGFIQTNSVGVVDESYKGDKDQWFMPVLAMRAGKLEVGDRVGQFRIMEKMPDIEFDEVDVFSGENRGGHGSTGVK